jgi:hypothetical protein
MQWRFGCCVLLFAAGGVPIAGQAISPIAVGRLARLDVLCAAETQRVGALMGVLARSDCLKDAGEYGGLCDLSYVVTVPAGALLGTIIGAVARTPKWQVVPIPAP